MADLSSASLRNGVQVLVSDFKDDESFRRDLLTSVVERVPLNNLVAVFLDETYANCYFSTFEHVITLLKEGLNVRNERYEVYHLYNVFTAYNVPPTLTFEEIADRLKCYGNVKEIENLPFCPNIPRFHHIRGNERRVFVEILVGNSISIPDVLRFSVGQQNDVIIRKYCLICERDGHTTNECSDRWSAMLVNNAELPQTTSSSARDESNSPIYIPEDVFQPIIGSELTAQTFQINNDSKMFQDNTNNEQSFQLRLYSPSIAQNSSKDTLSSVQQHLPIQNDSADYSIHETDALPPVLDPYEPVSSNCVSPSKREMVELTPAEYKRKFQAMFKENPEKHERHLEREKKRSKMQRNKIKNEGLRSTKSLLDDHKKVDKKRHVIWNHFKETQLFVDKDDVLPVKCKHCDMEIQGVIMQMMKHISRCKKIKKKHWAIALSATKEFQFLRETGMSDQDSSQPSNDATSSKQN